MRSHSPGPPDLGRIPVYLVDSTKSLETSPIRAQLGQIRLSGWQLDRLSLVFPDPGGRVPYLVRIRYEFDLDPDVPPPIRAEVRFDFPEPDVAVYDAWPERVLEYTGPASYQLNGQLNFVPQESGVNAWPTGSPAANIPLSALVPRIETSGIGGHFIQWRHSEEVAPGSHAGLLVLLVPGPWKALGVVANGTIWVADLRRRRLRPVGGRTPLPFACPGPVNRLRG